MIRAQSGLPEARAAARPPVLRADATAVVCRADDRTPSCAALQAAPLGTGPRRSVRNPTPGARLGYRSRAWGSRGRRLSRRPRPLDAFSHLPSTRDRREGRRAPRRTASDARPDRGSRIAGRRTRPTALGARARASGDPRQDDPRAPRPPRPRVSGGTPARAGMGSAARRVAGRDRRVPVRSPRHRGAAPGHRNRERTGAREDGTAPRGRPRVDRPRGRIPLRRAPPGRPPVRRGARGRARDLHPVRLRRRPHRGRSPLARRRHQPRRAPRGDLLPRRAHRRDGRRDDREHERAAPPEDRVGPRARANHSHRGARWRRRPRLRRRVLPTARRGELAAPWDRVAPPHAWARSDRRHPELCDDPVHQAGTARVRRPHPRRGELRGGARSDPAPVAPRRDVHRGGAPRELPGGVPQPAPRGAPPPRAAGVSHVPLRHRRALGRRRLARLGPRAGLHGDAAHRKARRGEPRSARDGRVDRARRVQLVTRGNLSTLERKARARAALDGEDRSREEVA